MAQTFSDLARRQPVLQGEVSDLRLDTTWQELRERVSVAVPVQTRQNPQLVSIKVRAPTREEATRTAAAIEHHRRRGQGFRDHLPRLAALEKAMEGSGAGPALQEQRASLEAQIDTWQRAYVSLLRVRAAGTAVPPRVFEPAEALPVRSAVLPITALAALVGLLLGIVLLYVLEAHSLLGRAVARRGRLGGGHPSPWPRSVPLRRAAAHEPPRRGRPRISHDLDLAF